MACLVRGALSPRFAPDLIGNLTGGHLLASDPTHLYDVEAQHTWQRELTGSPGFLDVYVSPPPTALLFWPLAALPLRVAEVVFTLLSLGAFITAVGLARPLLTPRSFALGLVAFAGAEPVAETILCGQTSGISLLLWMAGVRLALARRDFAAGAVLGLGLLKPQLFIVVPLVLLVLRRWRGLAGFAASGGALVTLGALAAGLRSYVAWVKLLRGPGYAAVKAANMFHMASIEATMRGILPPSVGALPIVIHAALATVLVAVLVALARRGLDAHTWAAAVLATLIVAPHLIVYDVVLLAVPITLLADELRQDRKARLALLVAYVLAWTMPFLRTIQDTHWPSRVLVTPLLPFPILALLAFTYRADRATSGSTGR